MLPNLLHIPEGHSTENRKTSIEPDVLRDSQRRRRSGEDHRSETRESNDSHASEEGSSEPEELVVLGCSADDGDTAHKTNSVETRAGNDSGGVKEGRSEECTLGKVKGGPQEVLLDGILWGCHPRRNHSANRSHKPESKNHPGRSSHESVRPAHVVETLRRKTNHSNADSGVDEGRVEIFTLVEGHAASRGGGIVIKGEIESEKRSTKDESSLSESLRRGLALVDGSGGIEEAGLESGGDGAGGGSGDGESYRSC